MPPRGEDLVPGLERFEQRSMFLGFGLLGADHEEVENDPQDGEGAEHLQHLRGRVRRRPRWGLGRERQTDTQSSSKHTDNFEALNLCGAKVLASLTLTGDPGVCLEARRLRQSFESQNFPAMADPL